MELFLTIVLLVCAVLFGLYLDLKKQNEALVRGNKSLEEARNLWMDKSNKDRSELSTTRGKFNRMVYQLNRVLSASGVSIISDEDKESPVYYPIAMGKVSAAVENIEKSVGSEERDKEFFRAGWERAKAHSNNPEPEPEKPYVSPERQELATILRVDVHCQEVSVWKKAKKAYALAHHPDRNQWADPELLGIMNALWDKVFG